MTEGQPSPTSRQHSNARAISSNDRKPAGGRTVGQWRRRHTFLILATAVVVFVAAINFGARVSNLHAGLHGYKSQRSLHTITDGQEPLPGSNVQDTILSQSCYVAVVCPPDTGSDPDSTIERALVLSAALQAAGTRSKLVLLAHEGLAEKLSEVLDGDAPYVNGRPLLAFTSIVDLLPSKSGVSMTSQECLESGILQAWAGKIQGNSNDASSPSTRVVFLNAVLPLADPDRLFSLEPNSATLDSLGDVDGHVLVLRPDPEVAGMLREHLMGNSEDSGSSGTTSLFHVLTHWQLVVRALLKEAPLRVEGDTDSKSRNKNRLLAKILPRFGGKQQQPPALAQHSADMLPILPKLAPTASALSVALWPSASFSAQSPHQSPHLSYYLRAVALHSTAAVVRFDSHTVHPWNILYAADPHWPSQVDLRAFGLWASLRRMVRHHLLVDRMPFARIEHMRLLNYLPPPQDNNSDASIEAEIEGRKLLPSPMEILKNWSNEARNDHVCSTYISELMYRASTLAARAQSPTVLSDRITVLISTFRRVDMVARLIGHYTASPLVDMVVVTWQDPSREPAVELMELADVVVFDNNTLIDEEVLAFAASLKEEPSAVRTNRAWTDTSPAVVVMVRQTTDTLNNRFNPIASIRTEAVLMIDDDIRIPLSQLEFGLRAWQATPERLVGFFPRGMRKMESLSPQMEGDTSWEYIFRPDKKGALQYSMVLTKGMFFAARLLFMFTCVAAPLEMHAYIDGLMNCEDIAMNVVASGLGGRPPMALDFPDHKGDEAEVIADLGRRGGISGRSEHGDERSNCLMDFAKMVGRMTLMDNNVEFERFTSNAPWVFRNVKDWPETRKAPRRGSLGQRQEQVTKNQSMPLFISASAPEQ